MITSKTSNPNTDEVQGGIVWKDDLKALLGQRLESPSSNIVQNLAEGTVDFHSDAIFGTDFVVINHQLNHDWKEGTIIRPHIHWFQLTSATPNWIISYRWQVNGQQKETSWVNQKYESNTFTYSSGTLIQITTFGDITPPSNAKISAILQIRLSRDTTNASGLFAGVDPLADTIGVINEDVHYQIDSVGSIQEYIKR